MRCGEFAVSQVLVGLHRVGIVGLRQACEKVASSGLEEREEIVDALLEELGDENYVSEGLLDLYRIALWREYLRRQGKRIDEFFSSLPVTVRGRPGEERDQLVDLCRSVLADFELRPEVEFDPSVEDDGQPELKIGDSTISRGVPTRKALKRNVRRRLSDW